MILVNETPLAAELGLGTVGADKPVAYVVVKATCTIPRRGVAALAQENLPVLFADEPYENPELRSVRLESDMVPVKPRADIVLVGKAHAVPRAATSVTASLRVGSRRMDVLVVGDRNWVRAAGAPTISKPQAFEAIDLVYERAYGGVDQANGETFEKNPLGRGYLARPRELAEEVLMLPNLEDIKKPIIAWNSRPDPVCFGFYPRFAEPRRS